MCQSFHLTNIFHVLTYWDFLAIRGCLHCVTRDKRKSDVIFGQSFYFQTSAMATLSRGGVRRHSWGKGCVWELQNHNHSRQFVSFTFLPTLNLPVVLPSRWDKQMRLCCNMYADERIAESIQCICHLSRYTPVCLLPINTARECLASASYSTVSELQWTNNLKQKSALDDVCVYGNSW